MPWWDGRTALPGITWVCVWACWQTWRDRVSVPKRLAPVIGAGPSAWMLAGEKDRRCCWVTWASMLSDWAWRSCRTLALAVVWVAGGDISCREAEGRAFGQRIAGGLVHLIRC